MKNKLKIITLSISLLSVHSFAEVKNTSTKESKIGWTGSLGLGFHASSLDLSDSSKVSSFTGIASSFKLGYNFTEEFSLYYVRNASWYTQDVPYLLGDTKEETFVSGITGIGVSYYFSPTNPALYAGLAVGLGDYTNVTQNSVDIGMAVMATLGYEFAPHWQGELSLLNTSIDGTHENTIDSTSLQVLINYAWY